MLLPDNLGHIDFLLTLFVTGYSYRNRRALHNDNKICHDVIALLGEPTRKIDQSDSFLPTTELAYKTVTYF